MVVWLQLGLLYVSIAWVSGPLSPTPQSADTQGSIDLVHTDLHPSWISGVMQGASNFIDCHNVDGM